GDASTHDRYDSISPYAASSSTTVSSTGSSSQPSSVRNAPEWPTATMRRRGHGSPVPCSTASSSAAIESHATASSIPAGASHATNIALIAAEANCDGRWWSLQASSTCV